jgi:hypothetical protein
MAASTINYRQLLKDTIRGHIIDGEALTEPMPHFDERYGNAPETPDEVMRAYLTCLDEVMSELRIIGFEDDPGGHLRRQVRDIARGY